MTIWMFLVIIEDSNDNFNRAKSSDSLPSMYNNDGSSSSLEPDINPDEQEEKARLISQVLELQNTLDGKLCVSLFSDNKLQYNQFICRFIATRWRCERGKFETSLRKSSVGSIHWESDVGLVCVSVNNRDEQEEMNTTNQRH